MTSASTTRSCPPSTTSAPAVWLRSTWKWRSPVRGANRMSPKPRVSTTSVLALCEHTFVAAEGTNILHADLDSFYASVEQRDAPHLRGRPVIVGGGVVLAASYEAKAYGVRSAMGGAQARRLCPWAIVVPPRMSAYSEASKAVFEVFDDTTPLVEGISIDEAFLDVGGLRRVSGTPLEIAVRLRARGPPAGRPPHHRRRGPHQVPGQGGQRRGQARRPAGGPRRPRARVPPPPAGRAAVGRGPDHGRQAPHPGHPHGGRGGRAARRRPGVDARRGLGPPPPRPGPQPRPPAGGGRPASALDGLAARPRPASEVSRRHRRVARGPRRPGHPPHARRRPGRPHRRPPAALRRLLPGHPLPHHRPGHGRHPGDPRRRPRPPRRPPRP